jgi:hypothetical protein
MLHVIGCVVLRRADRAKFRSIQVFEPALPWALLLVPQLAYVKLVRSDLGLFAKRPTAGCLVARLRNPYGQDCLVGIAFELRSAGTDRPLLHVEFCEAYDMRTMHFWRR